MKLGLFLQNNLYKLTNLILLSKGDAYNSSSAFDTCTSFELLFFIESDQRYISTVGYLTVS